MAWRSTLTAWTSAFHGQDIGFHDQDIGFRGQLAHHEFPRCFGVRFGMLLRYPGVP
ncbi:MAG: hypothetical protein K2X72_19835 [Reyranella sp.]|nr:hypothetical protein [Reyranella sp.]